MTANPVLRVERQRLRALGEAVQEARRGGAASELAGLAHGMKGVICMGLEGPEVVRAAWEFSRERLAAGLVDDFDAEWRSLSGLFDEAVRVMRGALEVAGIFAGKGYRIEGVTELEDAVRQVRGMHLEAFKMWPPDPKKVAQAEADFAAGKGQAVDEAFAQAAGVSTEDWLRRVEAHKAAREKR
jgi:hypothetical protein